MNKASKEVVESKNRGKNTHRRLNKATEQQKKNSRQRQDKTTRNKKFYKIWGKCSLINTVRRERERGRWGDTEKTRLQVQQLAKHCAQIVSTAAAAAVDNVANNKLAIWGVASWGCGNLLLPYFLCFSFSLGFTHNMLQCKTHTCADCLSVCLSAVSVAATASAVVVLVAFTCHSQFKTVNGKSKRCATKVEHTSYKELQRKWANGRDENADKDIEVKEGTVYLHTLYIHYIYVIIYINFNSYIYF